MTDSKSFARSYLLETAAIAEAIDCEAVELMVEGLYKLRDRGGRLFFLGVGGSAANASHAAADFRKLAGFEAYSFDSLAELTARTNDDGWSNATLAWLGACRLTVNDALFALSVGGGSHAVSRCLVLAIEHADKRGIPVFAIVGRKEGYAAQRADACVVVPSPWPERLTPHAEEFQSVILHLLVSHPLLKRSEAKWESLLSR